MNLKSINSGTILIIDDHPMTVMGPLNYLSEAGFEVLVSGDGESAIEQAISAHPDLILLDVLMPKIDGFETCKRLKSNEKTQDIPVIFITALCNMEDKIRGFEVGAVDYITKPIQYEELLIRIRTHLMIRHLHQQLQIQNQQLQTEIQERSSVEHQLRQSVQELSSLKLDLEQRVHEQTHQLRQTVEQLETEISDRKLAESYLRQSEIRFQKLAANLPGMIYRYCLRTDGVGHFSYVSAGCLRLLALDPHDVQQSPELLWRAIYPDDLRSLQASIEISAATLNPLEWEGRVVAHGKIKWIAIAARPEKMEWDDDIFWDGLMIDITDRKLAEASLQQGKAELEQRVEQRTQELKIANDYLLKEVKAHRLTEEALRLSEERYAIAVSGSAMGVWDWNLETQHLYVSSSLKLLLGYRDDEIGENPQDWEKFIYPDDKVVMRAALQAHLSGLSHQYEIEYRMLHKDGSIRWLLSRGIAIRNQHGEPYRITGTITNITERKQIENQLKQSQEFLDHILNAIADPVFVKNNQHRWIRVNRAFCQLVGFSQEQLIGKTVYDIFSPHQADIFWEKDEEVLQNGGENQHEEILIDTDGKNHVISIKKTVFIDVTGHKVLVGTIRDITELVAAKEAAVEASRLKSQFLTNVSHELRTPMNGIIGMTELLLRTQLDRQQQDFVQTLKVSAKHLLSLINDILDLSQLEAGKVRLEILEFDLQICLDEVVTLLASQAKAKGLRLYTAVDPQVPRYLRGDANRLRQVLTNLVDNAIKFTGQGEIVMGVTLVNLLRHNPLSQEATDLPATDIPLRHNLPTGTAADPPPIPLSMLRFMVRDTGIGIALDEQTKLFQSFSQVDGSTTRPYGGTGLGLVICKDLVELMGGEIGVNSQAGHGSEFWFTVSLEVQTETENMASPGNRVPLTQDLTTQSIRYWTPQPPGIDHHPMSPSDPARGTFAASLSMPPPHSHPEESQVQLSPLKILLVEDTPINQKVVMNQLKVLGYKAECVANGQEALDLMTNSVYDLVLMDCQMPVLDGYEATQKIRAREGQERHTLVIALTANAMVGDREKCLAAGMDDYISKPVSLRELKAVIDRWTQNRNQQTSSSLAASNASPTLETTLNSQSTFSTQVMEHRDLTPVEVEGIPIDWDRLNELSKGDREFELELLQMVITDSQTYITEAKEALGVGDYDTLARRAHQIKGTSATAAIRWMPEIAAQLEKQVRSNQFDETGNLAGLIQELETTLERVKNFVNHKVMDHG